MNLVYPAAVSAFLQAQVDVLTDAISAELLEGYVTDPADVMLSDVSGRFALPVAVTVTGIDAGTVNVDDIVFASVSAGHTVSTLLLYQDTGTDSTSRLLVALDRRADTTGISLETNDGDVAFSFPRGAFRI